MASDGLPRRPNRRFALAYFILILCSTIYVARGFHDERLALYSRDFKTVYSASRCLLRNCDPYDSPQLLAAYTAAGGPANDDVPFHAHESIYPPSALALLTPFAVFRWEAADRVWLVFSTGTFLLGVFLMAQPCIRMAPLISALGIGGLLLTSTTLIMLGQPTQLAVGLAAIGVWSLLEEKFAKTGVVCFALSVALKPHVAGALWIYFVLCAGRYRRRAWQIFALTVLVSLPGVIWATAMTASSHWLQEMQANLAGITARGMPGDPGPANPDVTSVAGLETILSLFRDEPRFYNRAAHATGLFLFAGWLLPVLRMRPSRDRDYFALASMACLSLLPLYHREYDTRILLLVFPALALISQRSRIARVISVSVTALTLILVTHSFINFVTAHVLPRLGPLTVWGTIFWLRPAALWTLILTLFNFGCFYAAVLKENQSGAAAGTEAKPFPKRLV